MRVVKWVAAGFGLALGLLAMAAYAEDAVKYEPGDKRNYVGHGLSMYGDLKYGPDAKQLGYVNPDAPKGGEIRVGVVGTFDSFNPYIIKGNPGAGAGAETLLYQSQDEPFAEYGLLAESVEMPPDRSWVIFNLRPEARWQDGQPVTADDVVFSFDILKEKGRPNYRLYYASVEKAEKLGERKVKFTFNTSQNRELPLIIGELPILPKHYWEKRKFDETTLEPPLSSGPYKVARFDSPRSIVLERDPNYWGKDLWLNRGRSNFQTIRYEYFRDTSVMFEAFKAGQLDIRQENISRNWAIGYDIPAVRDGLIKKDEIPNSIDQGMQAFIFNLRKPKFQDRRVRMAFNQLFDFEWANKNLFYGKYTRSSSYFSNSELASSGLPKGEELEILEKLRGEVPDEVFTKPFALPATDGSGENRAGLRAALELFKEAGWEIDRKTKKLTNVKTGEPMQVEILINDPTWERISLPFAQQLERLGIEVQVRKVDAAQYLRRYEAFDFDMVVDSFPESESPGNEQRDFWSSAAADQQGSGNSIGIKNRAIDQLIDLVIGAQTRASLVARTHALDRVLLWNYYVIPNWYLPATWVAYWDKFDHPKTPPKYARLPLDTWWFDKARATALEGRKAGGAGK